MSSMLVAPTPTRLAQETFKARKSMSIGGVYLSEHRKNFLLRFVFVLANLEVKFVERNWKWLVEETSGELRMASNGIGKERGRQLLHSKIAAIPKKFMSSRMDGRFMSGKMAELMFSTKILIIPAFERQDMSGEKESKKDIGGEFTKTSKFLRIRYEFTQQT